MTFYSTAVEREACSAAFRKARRSSLAWHCHHLVIIEPLDPTLGAESRIDFIVTQKSVLERPLRLRLFRPVRHRFTSKAYRQYRRAARCEARWRRRDNWRWGRTLNRWSEALSRENPVHKATRFYHDWLETDAEEIIEAHKKECPNCPWDGYTIFTDRVYR